MIIKKIFISATLLLTCAFQLFAQENSFLWKVSGNGLKYDAYLFGTIHILCAEDFAIKPKVKSALEQADKVILEVNTADPAIMPKIQELTKPDLTFLSKFTATQRTLVDSVLMANDLNSEIFNMVSPSTVYSLLTLKSFNCPNPMDIKMFEKEIIALSSGKKLEEFETVEQQFTLYNSLITPTYFFETLQKYDKFPALTQQMVQYYKEENLIKLQENLIDTNWMNIEQQEIMLKNRNHAWMKQIPEKLKDSKTFIAVGAGHLPGEDGMIALLRKAGYTVRPVMQ